MTFTFPSMSICKWDVLVSQYRSLARTSIDGLHPCMANCRGCLDHNNEIQQLYMQLQLQLLHGVKVEVLKTARLHSSTQRALHSESTIHHPPFTFHLSFNVDLCTYHICQLEFLSVQIRSIFFRLQYSFRLTRSRSNFPQDRYI